jgi:hypothetical protein
MNEYIYFDAESRNKVDGIKSKPVLKAQKVLNGVIGTLYGVKIIESYPAGADMEKVRQEFDGITF